MLRSGSYWQRLTVPDFSEKVGKLGISKYTDIKRCIELNFQVYNYRNY
jgi:hypothetical protein